MQIMTDSPTFVLSVEGTLQDGDTLVNPDFKNWFMKWANKRTVYLTANGTFSQTMHLVGSYLCLSVTQVQTCCGNTTWSQGRVLNKGRNTISTKARAWLEFELAKSEFHSKTGERIEERPGMLYGTAPGIDASQKEKAAYVAWDKQCSEREKIVKGFNNAHTDYDAHLDGDLGVSITAAGANKGQLVESLHKTSSNPIVFIGHKVNDLSNDQTVVDRLARQDKWHSTDSWQDTWKLLKTEYAEPLKAKR